MAGDITFYITYDLQACARLSIPMHQVDAHNVVPVWVASDKKETAARTIRKKIHTKLPTFLTVILRVLPLGF